MNTSDRCPTHVSREQVKDFLQEMKDINAKVNAVSVAETLERMSALANRVAAVAGEDFFLVKDMRNTIKNFSN